MSKFGHSQHSSEDAVVTILKEIHFEEDRINQCIQGLKQGPQIHGGHVS
jgi:hypothetical protein